MTKEKRGLLAGTAFSAFAAVLALTYAGYAWFQISRAVTAEQISLAVAAPNNVEISLDGLTGWTQNLVVDDMQKLHDDGLIVNGKISPASSLNGFDGQIFETRRANAAGRSDSDTPFSVAKGIVNTAEGYEGFYLDLPLYFRTGAEADVPLYLVETLNGVKATDFVPVKEGQNLYKTARIAFLSEQDGSLVRNAMGGDTPLVLASSAADTASVVTQAAPGGSKVPPQYIAFQNNYSTKPIMALPAAQYEGGAQYQVVKTTLRIWIEGEDEACLMDVGGQSFQVNLAFASK